MNIRDLVEEAGYTTKRKAACNGGEYSSPCPFCRDGDDRFLIWPNRRNKNGDCNGGRFSCRVCGKHGDAITFLRELRGLSYAEACVRLKLSPKKQAERRRLVEAKYEPPVAQRPCEAWRNKAEAFISWCHQKLMSNQAAIDLVTSRGFTLETIVRHKLGYNPGENGRDIFRERTDWGLAQEVKEDGQLKKLWLPCGIVVPTFSVSGKPTKIKVRRSSWKVGDRLPKYVEASGSQQSPSIFGDTNLGIAVVLESELDALLIQQFAGDLVYCVALGGSSKPIDQRTHGLLKYSSVLFCPDYDEAGAAAWRRWQNMFPRVALALTPHEKAPGDAFLAGADLREWVEEAIEDARTQNH